MLARHEIYLRREAGSAWPWTDDRILMNFKFTNVYREFDRQTVWIRENVREPFAEHPHLWFMLCIARIGYTRETLAQLIASTAWPTEGGRWSHAELVKITERNLRRNGGPGVFYAAYMVNHHLWQELDALWKARGVVEPRLHGSLARAFDVLRGYPGWGPFMSYEVVTDLRHTRYLRHAPDVMTWANMGPGSRRGLNRVLSASLNTSYKPAEFCRHLTAILDVLRGTLWPRASAKWPRLELRDVEHSLCEFDKYERARLGEGRPKQRYVHTGK